MQRRRIEELETKIQYRFQNKQLLHQALTHSSYANEHKHIKNNERLELLGDSILNFIVIEKLLQLYPSADEGTISKYKSCLVCTQALSNVAKQLELEKYIYLGNGANITDKILENTTEALIGAIWLDCNDLDTLKQLIYKTILSDVESVIISNMDFKTVFQEIAQKNKAQYHYKLIGSNGADHEKQFTTELIYNNGVVGIGTGRTKKQSEQEASKQALIYLKAI